MKKRYAFVCCGFLAIVCFLFWFFRPSPGYDINRVEPRLRAIQEPYQNIKTAYYLDGGSVGIEITDRDGRKEQFAIPAHLDDTNRYTKVFVGAMSDRKPGAIEVAHSEQTKRMLIQVLTSKPNRTPYDDVCLMFLRQRPADYVHCFLLKVTGQLKP